MKLFVDTGNVKEIEALAAIGIIDGVTTNPSLMAKETGDYRKTMKEICRIVQGPVSAEVLATDWEGMLREGRDLATIDEHIVVKVPFTRDGVRACKTLTREGLKVNVTLVFSAAQALLAAKVGRDDGQPVRRPTRRHRPDRHGAHPGNRGRSTGTIRSRPKCWSPARGIRSTSSKRRRWAPTSARARRR